MSRRWERVATTVINMAELYRGAFLHSKTDEKLAEIEELKDHLVILDMRNESAKYYGKIYVQLKNKGRMANDRDILISLNISFIWGKKNNNQRQKVFQ